MKITIEHYDETFTAELPDGANVAKLMLTFCNLLVLCGWSRENIIDLFTEASEDKSGPWDWSVE